MTAPSRRNAALPDPQWLAAEYDNRARHPDHVDVLARWAEASALARDGASRRLDLRYGTGLNEMLDVFPAARQGAPVLVFLHGGYWRGLDKSDSSFIAPSFVDDGAMVVVPNYPLCPAVSIEDIARALTRALAWVWRNAALYGGDPERIVVAGHSAGGHLAAMLLSCRWKDVGADLPPHLVGGALSISGLYDLEPLRHASFVQRDLQLTPAAVKRLSPAFFPRPKRPLYAVVGLDESAEFQRQNLLIRAQWGPTMVPVCETLPHVNHFTILHNLADPAGRLHDLALRLLGLR